MSSQSSAPSGTTESELDQDTPLQAAPKRATGLLTPADLAKVSRTKVFFGHQSVGMNLLDGVGAVYTARKLTVPPIGENVTAGPAGGFVLHAYIGENEKPLLKIKDFDTRIRSGLSNRVDVAMMKFCYVDVMKTTDVNAIFTSYKTTIARLERDYPKVTFIKSTVPLMTNPGLLWKAKATLGGGDRYGTAENVARERLNALIRKQYAGPELFDLAALESTTPAGKRVKGTYGGKPYFALYEGYASDRGHLNAKGSERVAAAWLKLVAQVSPR